MGALGQQQRPLPSAELLWLPGSDTLIALITPRKLAFPYENYRLVLVRSEVRRGEVIVNSWRKKAHMPGE